MKLFLLLTTVLFSAQLNAQVTTIFLSDFSNPSNYLLSNNGGGDWIITSNAPQGVNSQSMGAMNSATPAAYALFDSDFLGGSTQDASISMTDYIDATGYIYVSVCFESYYKQGPGECQLLVSTDGGITWTQHWVHDSATLPLGDSTANPSSQLIDISAAVAGNPSAISLKFNYSGATPGYAWMVDNVCVMASNSPTIGLNNLSDASSVLIHPNPASSIFSVDLSNVNEASELRISDLQGRVLLSKKLNPSIQKIDLALDEAPGTYFVTIVHSEGETRSALMKK